MKFSLILLIAFVVLAMSTAVLANCTDEESKCRSACKGYEGYDFGCLDSGKTSNCYCRGDAPSSGAALLPSALMTAAAAVGAMWL
eukprot:CAMPEP_0177652436 /NCGR_PEP_ID=MMETSP0447-20121125/13131_1 /TAXON_ID=0 /ORGANISM="Stygamoeba regulata, Strain BSH-02190019" /LENGTH=84 /DNA_ID=CAMNT_0019155685 /DNA_START=84 /DNA_END=338 /DNA_ORIENTATION=-